MIMNIPTAMVSDVRKVVDAELAKIMARNCISAQVSTMRLKPVDLFNEMLASSDDDDKDILYWMNVAATCHMILRGEIEFDGSFDFFTNPVDVKKTADELIDLAITAEGQVAEVEEEFCIDGIITALEAEELTLAVALAE